MEGVQIAVPPQVGTIISKDCYPGTNRTRPDELSGGGRGEYCCVPGCKNARYDKHGEKTKIGLF